MIPPNNGNVTGLQQITGRNIVYVIQNGELRIYDTDTNQLQVTPGERFKTTMARWISLVNLTMSSWSIENFHARLHQPVYLRRSDGVTGKSAEPGRYHSCFS